jgi:membrane protease YdiL (CAAX protease family)
MKSFARKNPVWTFLLINFAWTWLFWLGAIPFRAREDLLVTAIVLVGGYGPALAGILTLRLQSGSRSGASPLKIAVMILSAALIFYLMVLRYQAGNIPEPGALAEDLSLNVAIVALAAAASLLGGWVISSAFSRSPHVRATMATLLPWRLRPGWTVLGLVFYPALILLAWGLASIFGLPVEYPALWGSPTRQVLPLFLITFGLTAVAQGGLEEPGWRGLMQPALQKRFSPLVAALIVSVFWSLWHLPLYLNGFYPGDLVGGMVGGAIFRVLLSIFLAWFYNRSGGSLFLMIYLHTCFNVMVNFLPTSDAGLAVLWLIVVGVVVFADKMYRKRTQASS